MDCNISVHNARNNYLSVVLEINASKNIPLGGVKIDLRFQ